MQDISLTVQSNIQIALNAYQMVLLASKPLPKINSGQFVNLDLGRPDLILRRPFCIFSYDETSITLIYAAVGKGSKFMTTWQRGHVTKAILPLGNGFTVPDSAKNIVLLGGGIGAAPLYNIIKQYPDKKVHSFIGFSTKADVVLDDFFKQSYKYYLCTDDGSMGLKGFPTDFFAQNLSQIKPDIILTCGPGPMVRAVKKIAIANKIPAFFTGESRMACGVGACLVCTCKVNDGVLPVNKRSCVDGPVFDLSVTEI